MSAIEDSLEKFAHDLLVDAFTDASRAYWLRRAAELEAARPRRGDFTGNATPQSLSAAWDRLTQAAAACRARAASTDVAIAEALEALHDLESGAAA